MPLPMLAWCLPFLPMQSYCPPSFFSTLFLLQELREPAFAHAGMVSAAQAIFEDMSERGILQQVGGWVAGWVVADGQVSAAG